MNRDQRGITFIELIIAIAIASIIMVAATMFLGAAHKNYNNASAQVEALDPSTSGAQGIVIYRIPRKTSVENPNGAAAPEPASKRVIWLSAGGKKLYTKKAAVADTESDTTVIDADVDEVQQNLLGEYVTAFTGTVDASSQASVTVSFQMEYLKQKYEIQNVFKLRNVLR